MKKYLFVLITIAMLPGTSVFAEVKIGVVDLQKVLQASTRVKILDASFKKQFESREEKINQANAQLQKNVAQFKQNVSTMTDEQKNIAENKINKERNDLELLKAQFQQDVQDAQTRAMKAMIEQINTAINTIVAKEHYDLILQRSNTVYYKPTFDITAQVIKSLK